ncbi:MAG TPA: ABC transporter ATP-binding protein, partial [Candidatus Limiplasma sp.]|nr:ABC transporter ATP-binding protein [Candidatus Limiplasma sp.]
RKRAVELTYAYPSPDGSLLERSVSLQNTGEDAVFMQLAREGKLASVHSAEPTLNDVFVEITGRRLQ